MRKELSVATILKDKPRGVQLFDLLHNVKVELDKIESVENNNQETIIWCKILNSNKITILNYSHIGTEVGWLNGLQILKPSQEMRDWSKFAWKKGDILQISHIGFCTFEEWASNDYTTFKGRYGVDLGKNNGHDYDVKEDLNTSMWHKVDNKDFVKEYLCTVEERFGGKLNLDTLRIEKPQFKDGDIVFVECVEEREADYIVICKNINNHKISDYCSLNINSSSLDYTGENGLLLEFYKLRLATEEEKQRLFDALEKEGKRWNAETKTLEDLPKKCEFKPMDWCLMRRNFSRWELCQFSWKYDGLYHSVGGGIFHQCIPYNDQTAHLLGTTDDWEGGEG